MAKSDTSSISRVQSAKDTAKNTQNTTSHTHGTPLPPKTVPSGGKK